MQRTGVLALLTLVACSTGGDNVASAPRQDVEILPAPKSSDSALALVRATPKLPERSLRGHWYSDEQEAATLAREEQRPLLVDFAAAWCAACKELEKVTYPAVAPAMHRFVLLRVDATNEDAPAVKQLLARYNVIGLPAVILIDSAGAEVKRITQFVDADAMREALEAVR